MINKEIISKSIDNAIYKSHQHLTLNDKEIINQKNKLHEDHEEYKDKIRKELEKELKKEG